MGIKSDILINKRKRVKNESSKERKITQDNVKNNSISKVEEQHTKHSKNVKSFTPCKIITRSKVKSKTVTPIITNKVTTRIQANRKIKNKKNTNRLLNKGKASTKKNTKGIDDNLLKLNDVKLWINSSKNLLINKSNVNTRLVKEKKAILATNINKNTYANVPRKNSSVQNKQLSKRNV